MCKKVYEGGKEKKGKTPYELVLPEWEEAIADVLGFGAEKYHPFSWKKVENPDGSPKTHKEISEDFMAAARRHMTAIRKGELTAEDSSLPHYAHAITDICIAGWHAEQHALGKKYPE